MNNSKILTFAAGALAIAVGVVVFDPTAAIVTTRTESSTVSEPAPSATLADQPAVYDTETICGFEYPSSPVVAIAADEINRLQTSYPSVCSVQWAFTGMTDYLGLAYDNSQNLILISLVENFYTQGGDELDTVVRHVIRHEFGHQITYETYSAYFPENAAALATLFETTPDIAYEVAADAMSVVLDPSGSYPRAVSVSQIASARAILSSVEVSPATPLTPVAQ